MASEAELRWWDRFADVMARQWNLTPAMNAAIRAEYEADYEKFLFRPGGRLLDVGCGTGVRTHGLARRGMEVDGIDFSASQLDLARELAARNGTATTRFFRRDIVNDEWSGRHREYDAVFVCALLHHLSYDELDRVFQRMARSLAPGGVAYLYEPIVRSPMSWARSAAFGLLHFGWRATLGVLLRAARRLDLYDPDIVHAMADGYTGISPDERALDLRRLEKAWQRSFELVELRPLHQYSLAYAMSLMLLRERHRPRLEPLAGYIYRAEKRLFRLGMWENAGTDKRWILCSVKLRRAG